MLFRMEFEVVYANGDTATVSTRPRTDVAFEQKFGVTIASLFTSAPTDADDITGALEWIGNLSDVHACFMAWHALRVDVGFDEWIDTVEEVKWKFAAPPDPTPPAPSAGSSASSLSLPPSPLGNSHSATTVSL